MPITEADKASPLYEVGVSCPHCHGKITLEQKQRFAEREKQIELSKLRGEQHIGSEAAKALIAKREAKLQRRLQQREQMQLVQTVKNAAQVSNSSLQAP